MTTIQIAFSQPVALCLLLDTSFKMPLQTIDALQIPKTNKSPQKENPLHDVVTLNGQLDKILAEAQKRERHREEKETKKEKGRTWKKENKEKSYQKEYKSKALIRLNQQQTKILTIRKKNTKIQSENSH